ncbi:glutamyl-tRNA reductase [Geothermobacter hydrogeniphilus]|uniref:Glutamyl-tRNA reductase n=1 Tax=Geothermobacter hydrogeniphilus TaxID=1969733 RepID=A0A1X0YAZ8_9BACT|nr:glutamyl-tRNA reductase [Geothermobacter hydrogeniphilus]ORJ62164.1 glutamyl-tRNA reductase [Geothermobacter hydrogeniphilus]
MNIIVVGLSHHSAPVEIREKVAFSPNDMQRPLRQVFDLPDIGEAMIVSTCNRVEIYATSRDPDAGIAGLRRFMADFHQLSQDDLQPHLYDYQGEEAIRHVFRVSASLDSMVIGEPQILGQIKTAYGYAAEFKTVGLILNRFLHKAFSVAKRVRTETNIAGNAVSVSFAAVELARKIFGSLDNKTVLLIGAGEMCELAAKHFINNGVGRVLVTNRTFSRAERLAAEFAGRAIPFEEFPEHLHLADIVLTSTGAPTCILDRSRVEKVLKIRKNKPMFFIDIAVPRDIEPQVNGVPNVYLYDVDDLQGVVQANLKERHKEAKKAEEIIDLEIGQFHAWMGTLQVKPTIVSLRRRFEEIRRGEVEKTLRNLKHVDKKQEQAIEALTSAIINKILHPAISALKEKQNGEGDNFVDAVRTLFALEGTSGETQFKPLAVDDDDLETDQPTPDQSQGAK